MSAAGTAREQASAEIETANVVDLAGFRQRREAVVDDAKAERQEASAQWLDQQRSRRDWEARQWRTSDRGNDWTVEGHWHFVVYPIRGNRHHAPSWGLRITNTETEAGRYAPTFAAKAAAKVAAFNFLSNIEAIGAGDAKE